MPPAARPRPPRSRSGCYPGCLPCRSARTKTLHMFGFRKNEQRASRPDRSRTLPPARRRRSSAKHERSHHRDQAPGQARPRSDDRAYLPPRKRQPPALSPTRARRTTISSCHVPRAWCATKASGPSHPWAHGPCLASPTRGQINHHGLDLTTLEECRASLRLRVRIATPATHFGRSSVGVDRTVSRLTLYRPACPFGTRYPDNHRTARPKPKKESKLVRISDPDQIR